MPSEPNYKSIAANLVSGEPLAYKPYPDGSLVVIGPSGKKYKFTPEQVDVAAPKPSPKPVLKPNPQPDPKPERKPQPKRSRPPKK